MKKFIGIFVLVCAVFISCADPDDTAGKSPGRFAVQADNSRSVMARNTANLGPYNINTARTIYFYLKNIGDYPITDIALSLGKHGSDFEQITNKDFVVFPTKINNLASSNTSSVDTFIELNVNHGHIIGSIAQPNVIKNGVEGVLIRITGMTTDGENEIPVSLDVNVDMDIKVAAFDIVYGDDYTVATKYGLTYSGSSNVGYLVPSSQSNKVRLYNTGNVNLGIKIRRNYGVNWEGVNSLEEVLSL